MTSISEQRQHSHESLSPTESKTLHLLQSPTNSNVSMAPGSNNSNNSNSSHICTSTTNERHFCVICGDESDGLHFGQYTCRACAAFFRRTVSLKLQYTCKHDGQCEIEKSARNMCRSCRYEKCLQQGMLTSAVQHARDGLGKRKEVGKLSSSSSDTPDIKMPKPQLELQQQQLAALNAAASNALGQLYPPPHQTYSTSIPTTSPSNGGGLVLSNTGTVLDQAAATILQLNGEYETGKAVPTYMVNNFANLQLSGQNVASSSAFTALQTMDLSSSPSLQEIPQSNFGTSKKICKIEASLIMDTVEKFFIPFNQLSSNDKNQLFDSFYCLFSNTERAFRTYKMFGANDDRLLMPDGGYVRLSELEKFYENNTLVRGDPSQVAKIFESAMHYVVNVVVTHMRNINITEMELMALFGMFIWKDTVSTISHETMGVVLRTRDNILVDLHNYYRGLGLIEAEVTVKTANLFFLMPKLEHLYRIMKENYSVASVFGMLDINPSCCEKMSSIINNRN
ncbi:zinc finger, c4 type (two domains) domain-containing protein [Ditylenchus destructor]|nr:zinc finger, c4 type (two domains) domain-containing protein [Ditylenchus destructor]